MKVILFFLLFWPVRSQADVSQQIEKLDCVEEVGTDVTPHYTTYIVLTKTTNDEELGACVMQVQSSVNLKLLSVNYQLGLIVLRDTHN